MQLARVKRPTEGTSLLVGEAPPPAWEVSAVHARSFREMYERLHGPLVNHAERWVTRDDALDAVGDAMLALWRSWPRLSPLQRSDKYIFAAVRHRALRQLDEDGVLVSLDDAEPELDWRVVNAVHEGTRGDTPADVIDAALAAMPPRRREVLLLVREQDFSYSEAAEALGLSFGTIKTHLRLATQDLRAAFTRSGFRIANLKTRLLPSPKGGDTND